MNKGQVLLNEAQDLNDELLFWRREIHKRAEVGFDLNETTAFVEDELHKMGIEVSKCGKAGLMSLIGGKKAGKTVLLRADMDALPIKEETDLEFAAENGNMHACGHDMHTAMLMGAAKLLKAREDEIKGSVKLMFQPAEELLEGALDMIDSGVLEDPEPNAAIMLHIAASVPLEVGTVVVASGTSSPSADYFEIKVSGRGCHGAMPNEGRDPITAASNIILALAQIKARELPISARAVLTFGKFQAGEAANVIPDTAFLSGTIRAYDEEIRQFIKTRLTEISEKTAETFRCRAKVSFKSGCPSLLNDERLSKDVYSFTKELLGEERVIYSEGSGAGSEDFAFISREVPSGMIALSVGEGYPTHHPKADFDESVLPTGAAVYANTAIAFLENL